MNEDVDADMIVASPINATKTVVEVVRTTLQKIILACRTATSTSQTKTNCKIIGTIVPAMVLTLIIGTQVQLVLYQGGTITM